MANFRIGGVTPPAAQGLQQLDRSALEFQTAHLFGQRSVGDRRIVTFAKGLRDHCRAGPSVRVSEWQTLQSVHGLELRRNDPPGPRVAENADGVSPPNGKASYALALATRCRCQAEKSSEHDRSIGIASSKNFLIFPRYRFRLSSPGRPRNT